jgi:tetratricopeptide (TPR) repeat protein
MMRNAAFVTLAGLAVAAPLSAQTQYNTLVVDALRPRGRYEAPLCPLKGSDFRTNSAGVYLKTAAEGFNDAGTRGTVGNDNKKYTDIVAKAQKVALESATNSPNNAAGWYYLGRSDIQLGDLKGADSAFTRLETLSPDCASEIKSMRQKAWVALVTPSVELMRKGQTATDAAEKRRWNDSALAVLRDAGTISRYYPQGFYNMAGVFANMQPPMVDSALFYFKLAQEKSATDPQFADQLKNATYNLGYMYQQAGDNANAIVQYRKYLTIDPGSTEVKRALASTLRLMGNVAEASQLEQQLMSAGSLNSGEMAGVGVRYFNEKNYPAAADAFQKILATDPTNYDALFNLANTYFAMQDAKKLIETSEKLLDIAPLGRSNLQLLFNGYRLASDTGKQIEVYNRLQSVTAEVAVVSFAARKDGAKWAGTATGHEGRNASDKVIVPAPMTLVFEFTNAQGAVVATQEVVVQPLKPDAKQDLAVDVTGAGITGWRYHVKK